MIPSFGKCGIFLVGLVLSVACCQAQAKGGAQSQGVVTNSAPVTEDAALKSTEGTLVDQVIAIVNGDLVLESDVQEDRRFVAFQPYNAGEFDREKAIERLIDRTLILQQAKLQPDDQVTRDEAIAQLNDLRKTIPACKQAHCETEEGWRKFVQSEGFTVDELIERWRQRMEVLKFIEIRFRSGILISQDEVKAYYEKTLLPEYAKRNATAPAQPVIADRIQEILLQQRVSSLLGDWLNTLKAQGSVRVMRPDTVQP